MFGLMKKVRQLMNGDRRGVTALEYGLIAAVIGGVVITGASTVGNGLGNTFTQIGTPLTTATAYPSAPLSAAVGRRGSGPAVPPAAEGSVDRTRFSLRGGYW